MAKTSNAVKDRWNAKNYDDLRVRIPKGRKADVETYASSLGTSVNGLINSLLQKSLGMSETEWKQNSNGSRDT